MTEKVWRTQCVTVDVDVDPDPPHEVLIGPVFNGKVIQDSSNPVLVRFSELKSPADMYDPIKMRAFDAARKKAKEGKDKAAAKPE